MIKQKYNYKFFVDNYKYCHDSIFKKYYKHQENKYKYFICIEEDININKSIIYRSNEPIEKIINQLNNMSFQRATIRDIQSIFPNMYQYTYCKIGNNKYITKEYKLRGIDAGRINYFNDNTIYKKWHDERYTWSVTYDNNYLWIYFDGINVTYYNNTIDVYKTILDIGKIQLNYNMDIKNRIEKLLKRMIKDNKDNYYTEVITYICDIFNITI